MPFSQLERNPVKISDAIINVDDCLVAKEHVKVVFPVWYEESQLAEIGTDVYTLGIIGFIVGNYFAANIVPANIRFFPSSIGKEKYNDVDYYVLEFEKGSTIVENTNLVKDNTMGYFIYHSLVDIGRVPWYMGSDEMIKLFDNMEEFTGVTYGDNHAVPEMIVSMIMRDKIDPNVYYRQSIQNRKDIIDNPPQYIALRNVPLGARNTTAKLMGSYFKEGLNSALMYPSETVERVEELLRQ